MIKFLSSNFAQEYTSCCAKTEKIQGNMPQNGRKKTRLSKVSGIHESTMSN